MSSLRKIYYQLPPAWRFTARRLYYWPYDLYDSLSGQRPPMVPPRGMIYTGSGDFVAQGEKMVTYFKELAGLQPNHKVLDIGSGIGRIAIPLTSYLDAEGAYEGFDVVKRGVDWCQKEISNRFPNFHFQYIDLENDLYKASGADAAQFTFPYEENYFDLTVLISVFTHMLPAEVGNYLKEIKRVLAPGGQCFATFFIVNEETGRGSNTAFTFSHDKGEYLLMDEQVQSANVAFKEDYLNSLITEAGLQKKAFYPGYWSGRDKSSCKDFQDILILEFNK
jgi:SAM-dependent methyltransferase